MLSAEGRWRSHWSSFAPRTLTALALVLAPGCLLVQPLDEATADAAAGESGTGGTGNTGGSSGGKGGATGGKGGGSTGGTGGATGGGAGNGAAAGSGGSSSGGAGTGGGGAGAGGSAGSGNTGNVPLVYGAVWTFDDDVQDWDISYSEPAALAPGSSATHSTADGDPDDGAVELTVPFDAVDQTVELGVSLPAPLDLDGKTLAARVKLDSGFFGATDEPGGAKFFVKTGSTFVYADGDWTNLEPGEWVTVVLDMDAPDFDEGIDATDVRELGVTFKSSSAEDADWSTATLYVDTVGWVGAERPACILDPLLIDDMDTPDDTGWVCHTNGRNGGWYVFDDGTEGTRTPPDTPGRFPLEELDVARGGNTRAVHVTAEGYVSWGGAVGTSMVTGAIDEAVAWDASAYAGFSFWARGSGTIFAQVSLKDTRDANQDYPGTCQPAVGYNCNDNYTSNEFALTSTWTEYVVPFATLSQEGWGHPVPWTYDVNAIEFRWGTDAEPYDIWLDDLRFIERECDDDDPVECSAGGQRCNRGTLVATDCASECSKRGYADATCTATGCECDTPVLPNLEDGIDAMCACGMPALACSDETRALMEAQGTAMGIRQDAMLCYANYNPPTQMDCEEALLACWDDGGA